MEWIKGEMFTLVRDRPVDFNGPWTIGGQQFMQCLVGENRWLVLLNGRVASFSQYHPQAEHIVHRPPAPCEHVFYVDSGSDPLRCVKCGDLQKHSPSPPDSVEAARKFLANYDGNGRADVDVWAEFVRAYIAEQTAQRKAAGELAERCLQYNSTGSYQFSPYDVVAGALWGYARCRAGKDGGK